MDTLAITRNNTKNVMVIKLKDITPSTNLMALSELSITRLTSIMVSMLTLKDTDMLDTQLYMDMVDTVIIKLV